MTSIPGGPDPMKFGALVPHPQLGTDGGAIRAFATGLEALGYHHVLCYEHVLGAGRANRPDWTGPYDESDPFHEPVALYSFMAGATQTLGFMTGILVLPQRQTALLAKQVAELAIVSGGRFRLGVGIGWNRVEYEALGVPYERRAARYDEQLGLLRQLWTEPVVDFDGEFHRVPEAGINPLPPTPIPVWLGCGDSPVALDRVVRLADGWVPSFRGAADAEPALQVLRAACDKAGRSIGTMGIEARLVLADIPRDDWGDMIESWRGAGASHLSISTYRLGLETLDQHLEFFETFSNDHISPTDDAAS